MSFHMKITENESRPSCYTFYQTFIPSFHSSMDFCFPQEEVSHVGEITRWFSKVRFKKVQRFKAQRLLENMYFSFSVQGVNFPVGGARIWTTMMTFLPRRTAPSEKCKQSTDCSYIWPTLSESDWRSSGCSDQFLITAGVLCYLHSWVLSRSDNQLHGVKRFLTAATKSFSVFMTDLTMLLRQTPKVIITSDHGGERGTNVGDGGEESALGMEESQEGKK